MEFGSLILVALLVLLAACWLVNWHIRSWRVLERQVSLLDPAEFDFRRRQLRRRVQTSGLMGLVGLGMLVGRLVIVWRAPPLMVVLYWGGVVLLVIWMGLLGVADMISTRHYFSQLRHSYLVEQARLSARLRRREQLRREGQTDKEQACGDKGTGEEDC